MRFTAVRMRSFLRLVRAKAGGPGHGVWRLGGVGRGVVAGSGPTGAGGSSSIMPPMHHAPGPALYGKPSAQANGPGSAGATKRKGRNIRVTILIVN
jgi:hypothetical protein